MLSCSSWSLDQLQSQAFLSNHCYGLRRWELKCQRQVPKRDREETEEKSKLICPQFTDLKVRQSSFLPLWVGILTQLWHLDDEVNLSWTSYPKVIFCFVLFSHSVVYNSLWPQGLQHVPVLHYFPEVAQFHVHWVGDVIQPSHSLLSPSPPAFNLSQREGLFQWVGSSHQVAKVLELQIQHPSF